MIKKIRKKFKKVNSQKGFTLLEILVVLTIMGFLIAMVAPRLAGISGSAVDTVCDSNQNRMITYMSTYYEDTNRYPNKLTNLVITDGATLAAATYQIPAVSDQDPDNEAEVLSAEFNDRNHFHSHVLNADEASELKGMGIVEMFNLNDYSGVANAIANTTNDVLLIAVTNERPSMEPVTPAINVGVAMIGCGCTDNTDGTWVATNKTERGWGEPDWFGRIILGMGPECGLITSGVISNAAHCPGGIQNADNVTYNDYNLVLPRLEATATRMEDASFGTAIPGIAAGPEADKLECIQYDDELTAAYDYVANGDNYKVRYFDITAAQEKWRFATQCPEGHAYPEDDGEFWGIDLAAVAALID
ncbi:MAG: prepilin-type N-terminal cleavage/methylation domain-containing protein [Thermodesulfobacteriota bacterium]|nr:prepilin-type N-terminal cleavage/methylation domain-containing protein [Thermodesulfobacteriota bacterium]